jgi:hypothetical protein
VRKLWVLSVGAIAACSSLPPVLSWEPPHIGDKPATVSDASAERAYQDTVKKYSDHSEVYVRLDTRLLVGATFQTWPFREARVHRSAAFEKLPQAEVDKRLAAERAEADASNDFFVGVHLDDYRFDDFDRKDTIWRVALIVNGQEVTPLKVERIGRANVNLRALYPYLDDFWTAYRFRFVKKTAAGAELIPEGTEQVTLRFASSLGSADLKLAAR